MTDTNSNHYYKTIGVLLATVVILFAGFETVFTDSTHVALKKTLAWQDYSSLFANLFLIALLIERALEIFYVSPVRLPEKRKLTRQAEDAASPKARSDVKGQVHEFRTHTRRVCLFAGFGLGILCGIAGIQVLEVVLSTDELTGWQSSLFRALDVILTGAILGGGSTGVNDLTSRLKQVVNPEE